MPVSNDLEARKEYNPMHMMRIFIPKSIYNILKFKSEEMRLPMQRLILFAMDNELDSGEPFNYVTKTPDQSYVEYAYAEQATKLRSYLMKFPQGTGVDTLLLCRRDIGIPDRDILLLALRELVEQEIAIEIKPPSNVKFKKYKSGYKYIRLKEVDRTALLARKKKDIARRTKEYNILLEDQ